MVKRFLPKGAFLAVLMVGLAIILTASAHAAPLKIDITQGTREPMPVALPSFAGATADDTAMGEDIMRVVTANLERSGLFRPIDPAAFIEQIGYDQVLPRFADWRAIKAQGLVTGTVTTQNAGTVSIAFRLWDIYGDQQIAGKEYTTEKANWRRIAHLISDEIYSRLTGESGYFDSRVVYIAESGPETRRIKRLAIMDQDGANHKFLTNGAYLVLTPRFSPSYQEVIYLSYAGNRPRVHIRNLETGQEDVVGEFDGMSFAPRFSHQGDKIVMSIAKNGNTDIFVMDLRTRRMRRLTDSPAIDTAPSFSPDGQYITFESDRGGSQQVYVMRADGSNVRRISFGEGRYGTPVWSPRGDIIAFTKMHKGSFYIGLMRADGTGERLLTSGYLVEGPTWSPNGRVLMYTRTPRGGRTQVHSIDITGHNERVVMTPMDSSDPSWSGLLPL